MEVLLVDDDLQLQAMLKQSLVRLGYNCRTAGNGVEALELIDDQMPEILLSDIDMPKMNGLELAEAINQKYPSIPMIAMSGNHSEKRTAQCLKSGFSTVLKKPLLPSQLSKEINDALSASDNYPAIPPLT